MATDTTITTVDCQKQVRSWSLPRSLMQLLIPTCNCTTTVDDDDDVDREDNDYIIIIPDKCSIVPNSYNKYYHPSPSSSPLMKPTTTTITATIFRYRRGKINLCIQTHTNSISNTINPILLLELAVPTSILAKQMRGGRLRIVLESTSPTTITRNNNNSILLSTPMWTMYCNGRKLGYAVKRRPSKSDLRVLSLMRSVAEGTGVMKKEEFINEEDDDGGDQVVYLRANFRRVRGSKECESFHLIDPDQGGGIDRELSIFFFSSSS